MGNTTEYVSTYNAISKRLEAIKVEHEQLLQEVEQLKDDERRIMAFIAKESAVGGLFSAEIAEWQAIKQKYAVKV